MLSESGERINIGRLILWPAVITLAVTLLRLLGELMRWSPTLFNRGQGGPGAIVGIVWLAPLFGIYFAVKLTQMGSPSRSPWRAIGFAVGAFVIMFLAASVTFRPPFTYPKLIIGLLLMVVATAVPKAGWSSLFKTLLAYGYAARIPVAIIMFFAIRGNWGTHYDVAQPEVAAMGFWREYLLIGLLPQLIFWIAFTVVTGSIFGSITGAILSRSRTRQEVAAT